MVPDTAAGFTVTVADAVLVVSVTEVAVTVTVCGAATQPTGVKVTACPEALVGGLILPPPDDTVHATPLLPVSFCTVAVNCAPVPAVTVPVVGDTEIETFAGAAVTVMVAEAVFVPSATEVAVTVTVAGLGTVAGAVYVTAAPDALLVGATEPPPEETVQFTPLAAVSFTTVAVSIVVAPVCTDPVAGATATEIAGGVCSGVELDPPPHPLTRITVMIVSANRHCAERTTSSCIKAVSLIFPSQVFPGIRGFRGAGSLSKQHRIQDYTNPRPWPEPRRIAYKSLI
jgi:hypothetical protein